MLGNQISRQMDIKVGIFRVTVSILQHYTLKLQT